MKPLADRISGPRDKRKVGIPDAVEGRGYANDNGVLFGQDVKRVGREKEFLRHKLVDLAARDVFDIRLSFPQAFNLSFIHIDPRDSEAFFRKGNGQGQTDVTLTDNPNPGLDTSQRFKKPSGGSVKRCVFFLQFLTDSSL